MRIFIPKLRGFRQSVKCNSFEAHFWQSLIQKLGHFNPKIESPILGSNHQIHSHVPRLSLIDNNNSNPHTRPRNKRTVLKMAQALPNTFFQIKPSAPILPTRKVIYFSSSEITPIFKLINSIWLLFRWRTVQQRAVVTGPRWWRVERRTYTLNSTRMQRCTVTVSS